MNDQKQQIIEKLQAANNILVTVRNNPSVDLLSAAIGLSLLLNKMNKHATAVFSGRVPSAMNFLKPEDTLERDTDSLRDFIIALDKSKADKLRYKVEEDVVKIFITPYKSSITEKDLVFSQGDFNVDVVVAIGVHQQQELDAAITAHGRILHDAVVISINNTPNGQLGSINWQDLSASSLAEMVTGIATDLGGDLLDAQIGTALLTGIVDETDHFGNQKTTPQTMTMSAALLTAGANQQLVARELGHGPDAAKPAQNPGKPQKKPNSTASPDGSLSIAHDPSKQGKKKRPPLEPLSAGVDADAASSPSSNSDASSDDSLDALLGKAPDAGSGADVISLPEPVDSPLDDAAEQTSEQPGGNAPESDASEAPSLSSDDDNVDAGQGGSETLSDLEKAVGSPHADESADEKDSEAEVDSARKAVEAALQSSGDGDVREDLNSINVNLDLSHDEAEPPLTPDTLAGPGPTTFDTPQPLPDPALPADPLAGNLPPSPLPPQGPPPPPPPFGPVAPGVPQITPSPAVLPTYPTPGSPLGGSDTPPLTQPDPTIIQPMPPNPAANEMAPLGMSPADQPSTMPLPPSMNIPGPLGTPPTANPLPPQGPPPPPVPPPMMPGGTPFPR